MDASETVPVYTVTNPLEAQMVCNMLAAEGIAASPQGTYQGGYLTGIEEIIILVHAEDADRARKILERHDEHGRHKGPPPEHKRD
jgi:hypothetical protein